MTSYLLALDQSTTTTGYAVFKDQELLRVGHFTSKKEDYIARIADLRKWLEETIDSLDGEIKVALEDIQLQEFEPDGTHRKQKDLGITTYKKLAHVQGAILSLLAEKNIEYTIILASTWKKHCKIAGRMRTEQKRGAQEFAINTYGLKPTQDEADAVCLGHCALRLPAIAPEKEKDNGFDWS